MRSFAWLLLAGCWQATAAPPRPTPAVRAEAPALGYTVSEQGLGPLGPRSRVMLRTLYAMFPGHQIVRRELPETDGLIYEAHLGDERVFYVVPADEHGPWEFPPERRQLSTRVSELFVVSARVRAADRPWRVGAPLADVADLETCRCWGDAELTACFAPGKHVAVVFERACDDAERRGPGVLVGARIDRLLWRYSTELDPQLELEPLFETHGP